MFSSNIINPFDELNDSFLSPRSIFGQQYLLSTPKEKRITLENLMIMIKYQDAMYDNHYFKVPSQANARLYVLNGNFYIHCSEVIDQLPEKWTIDESGIIKTENQKYEIVVSCNVYVDGIKVADVGKFVNPLGKSFPRNYLYVTFDSEYGKNLGEYGIYENLDDSAHINDPDFNENQTIHYGIYKWGWAFDDIYDNIVNGKMEKIYA